MKQKLWFSLNINTLPLRQFLCIAGVLGVIKSDFCFTDFEQKEIKFHQFRYRANWGVFELCQFSTILLNLLISGIFTCRNYIRYKQFLWEISSQMLRMLSVSNACPTWYTDCAFLSKFNIRNFPNHNLSRRLCTWSSVCNTRKVFM